MSEYKSCSKCDTVKELFDFCFSKDTQKFRNQCRDCMKIKIKGYQTTKKDEIKKRNEENRNNTKNLKVLYDIEYRERNRKKFQFFKKKIFQNNKEELYKKIKKRKDEDINFRLACTL